MYKKRVGNLGRVKFNTACFLSFARKMMCDLAWWFLFFRDRFSFVFFFVLQEVLLQSKYMFKKHNTYQTDPFFTERKTKWQSKNHRQNVMFSGKELFNFCIVFQVKKRYDTRKKMKKYIITVMTCCSCVNDFPSLLNKCLCITSALTVLHSPTF